MAYCRGEAVRGCGVVWIGFRYWGSFAWFWGGGCEGIGGVDWLLVGELCSGLVRAEGR